MEVTAKYYTSPAFSTYRCINLYNPEIKKDKSMLIRFFFERNHHLARDLVCYFIALVVPPAVI